MLPKKINKCPIIDALVEVRFTSNMPPNAIFGIIYNALKDEYPIVDNLPILQVPEPIRNVDNNLKFKPHYKISNEKHIIQIGPNVVSISSFPKYVGWESYSNKIFECLDRIERLGIIEKITRLGIRYINFFEENIFDKINLSINLMDSVLKPVNSVFKTEIKDKNFTNTLQVANNVIHDKKNGSIIDIDTFISEDFDNFFERKKSLISEGHKEEKELFFKLLRKKFIESLEPEY